LETTWVIGGERLFKESLASPLCHRVYLTQIRKRYECDVFLPALDEDLFAEARDERVPQGVQEENGVEYTHHVLQRKK